MIDRFSLLRRLCRRAAIAAVVLAPAYAHAGHLFTQAQANTPIALNAGQGLQITQLTYENSNQNGLVTINFQQSGGTADQQWSAGDAIRVTIGSWSQTFAYDTLVAAGGSQSASALQINSTSLAAANIAPNGSTNWTVVATAGKFTFEGYRIYVVGKTYNGTGAAPINQSQVVDASQLGGGGSFQPIANSPDKDLGRVLDALNGNATGQMGAVLTALNAMSETSKRDAMRIISPERSAALGHSSVQTGSTALDTVQVRLDALRSGVGTQSAFRTSSLDHGHGAVAARNTGESGLAAGDEAPNRNLWVKAFGGRSTLDSTGGFAGSRSNLYGMMFGYDQSTNDGWVYGASFSYAKTDVTMSDYRQGDGAQVDTYQATAYFGRNFEAWYLEGMVAYAEQRYHTARNTHLTGIARGNFDGSLYGGRLVAGFPIKIDERWSVTPFVGGESFRATQDAYTETDAGVLSLQMDTNKVTNLRSLFGAEVSTLFRLKDESVLRPSVKLQWRHEFNDDASSQNAAFVGGGGQFTSTGQRAIRDVYGLTGRLSWELSERFGFAAELGVESGAGYSNVNGQVFGRWRF